MESGLDFAKQRRIWMASLAVLAIVCAVSIVWITAMRKENPTVTPPGRPEIEVWLNGSVSDVKGLRWPIHKDGLSDSAVHEWPCNVGIHFPSGRHIREEARLLILHQENGKVIDIKVSPAQDSYSLDMTCRAVVNILRDLKVPENGTLIKAIQALQKDEGGRQVSVREIYENRVDVHIKIDAFTDRLGYYALVTFSYLDRETWELLTGM